MIGLLRLGADRFDIRQNIDNIEEELLKAVDEMAQYLDTFNRSVSIDSVFLSKNVLKAGYILQTARYKHVSQRKAYDIFALICDIGGSLGFL